MRRPRGFSLMEITLTLCLGLLLIGLGWVGRNAGRGGGSHGIAELLAEQLRAARQQAISTASPVAFVVPTQGGAYSHAQSFYILQGQSLPKVARVENLRGSFPEYCFFLGVWNLAAGTGVNSAARPPAQLAGSNFYDSLPAWLANLPRGDFALIFTPSGSVLSNGLVHFDGAYHIVVGRGVQVGGEVAVDGADGKFPFTRQRTLTRAAQAYTVNLSTTGTVSVSQGVTGADFPEDPQPIRMDAAAQPPSRTGLGANNDPTIVKVELLPPPNPDGSVTLARDQHLTMRVEAYDSDGDALYLRWTADQGNLSSSSFAPMNNYLPMSPMLDRQGLSAWIGNFRLWEGTWSWRPPNHGVWNESVLRCQVIDNRGGRAESQIGADGKASRVETGKIAFVTDSKYLTVINVDGSQRRSRTWNSTLETISWSPDGTHLAMSEKKDYEVNPPLQGGIRIVDPNLYDVARAAQPEGAGIEMDWNFAGNRIVATQFGGYPAEKLVMINSTGNLIAGDSTIASADDCYYYGAQWSYDGKWVAYTRTEANDDSVLYLFDVAGNHSEELARATGTQYLGDVAFSPVDNKIAYSFGIESANRNTHQLRWARIQDGHLEPSFAAGGVSPWILSSGAYRRSKPVWSPDGHYIAFVTEADDALKLWVQDMTAAGGSVLIHSIQLEGDELGSYLESPCWGPSSQDLLYIHEGDVYRAKLSGSPLGTEKQIIQVTDTPEQESHPRWSI